MKANLIAPCGMNCNLCSAFLREKDRCVGCRTANKKYCRKCIIKNCIKLKKLNIKYCSSKCDVFPCTRLKNLDKRYRTKYGMSMIENLKHIQNHGIRKFIINEKKRWIKNNKVFCVHNKKYSNLK